MLVLLSTINQILLFLNEPQQNKCIFLDFSRQNENKDGGKTETINKVKVSDGKKDKDIKVVSDDDNEDKKASYSTGTTSSEEDSKHNLQDIKEDKLFKMLDKPDPAESEEKDPVKVNWHKTPKSSSLDDDEEGGAPEKTDSGKQGYREGATPSDHSKMLRIEKEQMQKFAAKEKQKDEDDERFLIKTWKTRPSNDGGGEAPADPDKDPFEDEGNIVDYKDHQHWSKHDHGKLDNGEAAPAREEDQEKYSNSPIGSHKFNKNEDLKPDQVLVNSHPDRPQQNQQQVTEFDKNEGSKEKQNRYSQQAKFNKNDELGEDFKEEDKLENSKYHTQQKQVKFNNNNNNNNIKNEDNYEDLQENEIGNNNNKQFHQNMNQFEGNSADSEQQSSNVWEENQNQNKDSSEKQSKQKDKKKLKGSSGDDDGIINDHKGKYELN